MKSRYIAFIFKCAIYAICILALVISTNYFIDASSVLHIEYDEMAELSLKGNAMVVPQNYNERAYQVCIVEQMQEMPETVVIGSSRGMFLGKEITGYSNLYNNCVSGACLEDYYALMGLYFEKFEKLPSRVIIETSPWVFYDGNPETRWKEVDNYENAAMNFYNIVNDKQLYSDNTMENPYLSMEYFRYNLDQFMLSGFNAFNKSGKIRISTDENEAVECSDGSIRAAQISETERKERIKAVQQEKGACTYADVHLMTELGESKLEEYETLVDYLLTNGCEVIIYLQPFSVTQCKYSLDQSLNPGFVLVEDYLIDLCMKKDIRLIGGYDARYYGLTDESFSDFMHLDKGGTNIVWNFACYL